MSVTPTATPSTTNTGPIRFRADRFDDAMTRLGHRTERDRAHAAGITKMTLWRWRKSYRDHAAGLGQTPASAHKVAAVIGLTVDQLFDRVA